MTEQNLPDSSRGQTLVRDVKDAAILGASSTAAYVDTLMIEEFLVNNLYRAMDTPTDAAACTAIAVTLGVLGYACLDYGFNAMKRIDGRHGIVPETLKAAYHTHIRKE